MRISDWSSDVCSSDLRFGLGAFDEARVAEPSGKRVALLFRRGDPLGEPRAFGVEIDHACQRQDEGGFIDHHLRGAAGGQITVGDIDAREPGERDRKSTRMNSSHYCATSMPASA